MERALGDLKGVICVVYLDDIITFSRCWEQQFQDIQAVLDKPGEASLTVNMKESLKFLDHVTTPVQVRVKMSQ